MRRGDIPREYVEPSLNFKPTYKFDLNSDLYDTGKKKRIPAWTDRILFVERGMKCDAYHADFSLRTSDHRPVMATFSVALSESASAFREVAGRILNNRNSESLEGNVKALSEAALPEEGGVRSHQFVSESQVCSIS
jgi:hypothetical protein